MDNKKYMDKKDLFPEQEAPVKNTDRAYVKVADDGSPQLHEDERAPSNEADQPEEEPAT